MDAVGDYLWVPDEYGRSLGGLRWALAGSSVDYPDGSTFAFTGQIGLFLEGFTATGGLLHFAHVLHLLCLFGLGRDGVGSGGASGFGPLREAFAAAGRPLRNAGALAALLTHRVPCVARPSDAAEVCRRLANPSLVFDACRRWANGHRPAAELPPLPPDAFAAAVRAALAGFTPEELHHRLRHGHAPMAEAGEQLADALDIPTRTLEAALADAAENPRLAGALPMVEAIAAALTLPPRRRPSAALPAGGYADVATRGHPEQILPSQFALDDLEFVRRFAEHELLYFRREEPRQDVREELVVLLDQGVRTWGTVRLALSAAVLALGRLAVRRRVSFRIAATSADGRPVDPLHADEPTLSALVEASDLSPHPGAALERLLQEPATLARDVVLLTHPRSLEEPDVSAAARRIAGSDTRLFALAVDDRGGARFAEVRHGQPVALAAFRVDLGAGVRGQGSGVREEKSLQTTSWTGHVEPVPFPFRFGVASRPRSTHARTSFDFDHAGEWVLESGADGMLHLWRPGGREVEVLPRPILEGALLRVETVRGVQGGFAVCGRFGENLAFAHYDLRRRQCRVFFLRSAGDQTWDWGYFPEYHAVVARGEAVCLGVDLGTGERLAAVPGERAPDTRLTLACQHAWRQRVTPPDVAVGRHAPAAGEGPFLSLEAKAGTLHFFPNGLGRSQSFTPQADGRTAFVDACLLRAQRCGNTLVVLAQHPGRTGCVLWLFRLPTGAVLAEFPCAGESAEFTLSAGGQRLARMTERGRLEVRDLERGLAVAGRTTLGGFHPRVQIALGDRCLHVVCGTLHHVIYWDGVALEFRFWDDRLDRDARLRDIRSVSGRPRIPSTSSGAGVLPVFLDFGRRFIAARHGPLLAILDRYGQVALCEHGGQLVCMFFTFRRQAAAWMPDGTCCGPESLTGRPQTPNGPQRIAAALQAAWQRGQEASR